MNILMSQPLGSAPTTSRQGFHSYYGLVRRRATATVLSASGFCLGTLPLLGRVAARAQLNGRRCRRSPSHVPCKSRRPGSRRLYAGHRLARTRAPARLVPGGKQGPRFWCRLGLSTPQRRRSARSPPAEHFWNVFLVLNTHLTHLVRLFPGRSPRRSSANAAQGGLTPAPVGRRRRANDPSSLAQLRFQGCFLHVTPSCVRDTQLMDPSRSAGCVVRSPGRCPQRRTPRR